MVSGRGWGDEPRREGRYGASHGGQSEQPRRLKSRVAPVDAPAAPDYEQPRGRRPDWVEADDVQEDPTVLEEDPTIVPRSGRYWEVSNRILLLLLLLLL
jgi:hypothetical protein